MANEKRQGQFEVYLGKNCSTYLPNLDNVDSIGVEPGSKKLWHVMVYMIEGEHIKSHPLPKQECDNIIDRIALDMYLWNIEKFSRIGAKS